MRSLRPQDSPLGVHVFRHDLQIGVRAKGRDAIQLVAPRGETRWREALLAVQTKLSKAGCKRLVELPYDDPRVAAAVAATPRPLTSAAFAERPLADCTSAQRAKLLTSLCRRRPYVWEAATLCVSLPRRPQPHVSRAKAAHGSRERCRAGLGRSNSLNLWVVPLPSARSSGPRRLSPSPSSMAQAHRRAVAAP